MATGASAAALKTMSYEEYMRNFDEIGKAGLIGGKKIYFNKEFQTQTDSSGLLPRVVQVAKYVLKLTAESFNIGNDVRLYNLNNSNDALEFVQSFIRNFVIEHRSIETVQSAMLGLMKQAEICIEEYKISKEKADDTASQNFKKAVKLLEKVMYKLDFLKAENLFLKAQESVSARVLTQEEYKQFVLTYFKIHKQDPWIQSLLSFRVVDVKDSSTDLKDITQLAVKLIGYCTFCCPPDILLLEAPGQNASGSQTPKAGSGPKIEEVQ